MVYFRSIVRSRGKKRPKVTDAEQQLFETAATEPAAKPSRQRCTYCDREMIRRRVAFGKVHIGLAKTKDHVFPYSRGGRKTVPACYACNHAKSDMPPEIWELFMADNPSWWLLEKKDLRKARKKAILATAEFKRVAMTVPPPAVDDHSALREHWIFIVRCMRQSPTP
jgi:hypothetical protein